MCKLCCQHTNSPVIFLHEKECHYSTMKGSRSFNTRWKSVAGLAGGTLLFVLEMSYSLMETRMGSGAVAL